MQIMSSQPEQPKNVSEQPEVGGEPAASSSVDDFWVPDEIEGKSPFLYHFGRFTNYSH